MKVGRLHTRYTDSYLSIFTYSCSIPARACSPAKSESDRNVRQLNNPLSDQLWERHRDRSAADVTK